MSEAIPVAAQARRLTQVLEAHVELHSLGGGSRTFRVTGTDPRASGRHVE